MEILVKYLEKVKNSKDKKEWISCFLFLEWKIQESEWEVKETFIKLKDKMKDYFNKNIKYGKWSGWGNSK